MSEKRKVLGICLAKLQDRIRTEYLNAINKAAAIEGWKIVAYNSFRDFRKNDLSLKGSKSIYKSINYEEVDVIAVFPESINNSKVSDSLIERAKLAGRPVICIGPEKEGCYSVVREYEGAFRDMLNHIIKDHGARNLFFVGGFKLDDERTENRLRIFRTVLAENDIEFSEKRICYGDYKDEIIEEGIDRLMSGNDIPQAIVCIDDKTAITVCDKLHEYDLKSPDDVIVTGFGGIPAAYYYHPSITTCSDDVDKFAEIVLKAANDALRGVKPSVYHDVFKTRIRRSCGCDMRSYLSAGRREYDLKAARASGIYVPQADEDPMKEGVKEALDNDDTVFIPNAGKDSGVILKKDVPVVPDSRTDRTASFKSETLKDEPLYDEKTLSEFAASNPKLADMKMGAYDVTYGLGRTIEKQEQESAEPAKEQHLAKIYSSDIFKRAGNETEEPDIDLQNNQQKTEVETKDSTETNNSITNDSINNRTGFEEKADTLKTEQAQQDLRQKNSVDAALAAKRAMEVAEDKRCASGHSEERFRSGNHVAYIYKELDEIERREDSLLAWLDKMLEFSELDDILNEISKRLSTGSVLYLYSELLESSFDVESFEKKYLKGSSEEIKNNLKNQKVTRIAAAIDNMGRPEEMGVNDIVASFTEESCDGRMLVLNPVFIGDFVCGFYAVKTSVISNIRSTTKLLNTGLNLIFRFLANQNRQRRMLYNIENSSYVSSMTGLPNLKGSTRWFENFTAEEENHNKKLSISVFTMPRYTYIYENYGLNEVEDAVHIVVDKLRESCRKTSFMGQFAEGEYIIIDTEEKGSGEEQSSYAEELFEVFNKNMEDFNRNSTKEYFLEVNFGTATLKEGWDSTLENIVRMAMSDMYLRRLRQGKGAPVVRDKTFEREYFTTFELLVDRNLFRYHFQPIVDAETGQIYAYEALMRTGGGISMSPLDVLEIAKNANRLYDIEKATVFNVLQFYVDNLEKFGNRKIFINTIPGYYLKECDKEEVMVRFGDYLDQVVFEVTEGNTVTDEELARLREASPTGKKPSVAVDDYGTGHSNIVNLLRYTPQIIKIDRYLISNIQDDSNKQMFVKNTIEFAEANGMKVLAEGVESFEEMKTVIEYGADYIQGYYTARPSPEIMQQIPHNIKNEILDESIKASRYDSDNLTYNAKAGETVNLLEIALKKYTSVYVLGGKVKLVGEPDNVIDMVIRTADDKKTELIFENVNLRGVLETTVQLGRNSETALNISGQCTLNKDGINVPAGSRLTVSGDGNLSIITSRNLSVGIGSNCNEPYGDISFDMTGTIKIVANGDKAAGIGGGRADGSRIRLINGNFDISAKAIHAVAIGSDVGDTDIYIGRTVRCKLKSDGNDSISLGSISGRSEIVCRGRLDITGDGEKTVGIGSITGSTKLNLLSNDINIVVHAYCGIGVGSLTGGADIKFEDVKLDIYSEGTQINGIGSGEDVADAEFIGSDVSVEILAGIPRTFGVQKGRMILHYGSLKSLHDLDVIMLDEQGTRIIPKKIDTGVLFEK